MTHSELGETGQSSTHRQEAGRLSSVVHRAVSDVSGGYLSSAESISLAMLHAVLYVGDEIHELVKLHKKATTASDLGD